MMTDWAPVRLDHWSLAVRRCPLYPEDRYQLAVIMLLVTPLREDSFRVDVTEPQNPQWWRSSTRTIEDAAELMRLKDQFLLRPQAILDLPPGQQ